MFLTPDNIITAMVGVHTLTIKQKITPDGARATKDICDYVNKGDLVKPNRPLNNGTGKPKGITIHNTGNITVSAGTTPAEQYARATYPNGNMNGAAVHYWVWHSDVWQQLSDSEQGWHAGDGSSRRKDHRGDITGGNLDTISIECIGSDEESEDTLAKLVAYLCNKHELNPVFDVYTHNYWMHGKDSIVPGVRKNCPLYILPHWPAFIEKVRMYLYGYGVSEPVVAPDEPSQESAADIIYTVVKGDTLSGIASRYGTTYQALAAYNGIANPSLIVVGQKIKIPQSKQPSTPSPSPTPTPAQTIKVGSIVRLIEGAKTYTGGSLAKYGFRLRGISGDCDHLLLHSRNYQAHSS
jgi:LysM repeat protein